ncbi:hypothetical protein MKX03_016710 [Papaver bracteatum]|nr:hypothetical protein MKX03_016710 [Papaver bracteatum]
MPQQKNVADSYYYHQMATHQHFPRQSFIPCPLIPHHKHQSRQGSSSEENRTIWVGDLHYWMEENYLHRCFAHTREVVSIKVIRNNQTGQSKGYGFVELCTRAATEKVLQTYNGTAMPNAEQPFRLNRASIGMGNRRCSDRAKVVIDANTIRSKGYGFVMFGDDNERTQAIKEMNGVYCSNRPMRVGVANPRKSTGFQQKSSQETRREGSLCRGRRNNVAYVSYR